MQKWIASILMIAGLACVIYAGYQILMVNAYQAESLEEAKEIIEKNRQEQEMEEEPKLSPEEVFNSLKVGEVIGILSIPKLDRELPIIHGTDEDELDRGVGHYIGTVLPGMKDQILLSGHRDTVFRQLGELEIGDELIVEMSYGTYRYEIRDTEIVDADDRTVIRSMAPDEVLTVSTCYPFRFVGSAPDRYIIYAYPIEE